MRSLFELSTGLLLSGTAFAIVLAYTIRFLAASLGAVEADSMKELPATLLLRPFNFDTLATQVFTLVSLYRYEEAGLSALTIVLVSLAPVLVLHGIIAGSRPGAWMSRSAAVEGGLEWAFPAGR
jgi:iron(III) transport system permease protein